MRYQQWFQETELALTKLSETVGNSKLNPVPVTEFYTENMDADREELLRILFDDFGSDKAELGYHHIYSRLFPKPQKISNVFEIGLGTNNLDVPSNMGKDGVPGASLLAFQDFFPNADIHGADIDKRILFDRDRIHTHYVDQRSYQSFNRVQFNFVGDCGFRMLCCANGVPANDRGDRRAARRARQMQEM